MKVDKKQAERFLTLLDDESERFDFFAYHDKDRTKQARQFVNAELDTVWNELDALNRQGYGIFVLVNAGDGKGRKRENIVRARAVWQDDDTGEGAGKMPLEPHVTVETSKGKYHRYILIDGNPNLEEWEQVQRGMVSFGCDKNAVDLSRVLRLPGTMNMKGEPHPVRIIEESGEAATPWATIRKAIPPQTEEKRDEEGAINTVTSRTLDDLRDALKSIPADDRDTWVKMGLALKTIGEPGRELWEEWAKTSTKWKPGDENEWDTFTPTQTGHKAIFAEAKRRGWKNPASNKSGAKSIAELMRKFTVDEIDVKEIQEAKFIVPDLIVEGHVMALVAAPNAGKTALLIHLAPEIVAAGYQVLYLNFDASASEIARHYHHAKENGYTLIAPDVKRGVTIDEAVQALQAMSDMPEIERTVIIIDTLKKCVDVIHKGQAKAFYKILRNLSARGCTVVCAAHTNKYREREGGNQIYEGTGDLRSDFDELIYMDYEKADGKQVITTYPDKVRAIIKPVTYTLDISTRTVTKNLNVIDVEQRNRDKRKQERLDESGEIEAAIREAIEAGEVQQSAILKYCESNHGLSRKAVRKVLELASNPRSSTRWLDKQMPGGKGNPIVYSTLNPMEGQEDFIGPGK